MGGKVAGLSAVQIKKSEGRRAHWSRTPTVRNFLGLEFLCESPLKLHPLRSGNGECSKMQLAKTLCHKEVLLISRNKFDFVKGWLLLPDRSCSVLRLDTVLQRSSSSGTARQAHADRRTLRLR
jgi:hypothetical protein